jgi:hypothetical protein
MSPALKSVFFISTSADAFLNHPSISHRLRHEDCFSSKSRVRIEDAAEEETMRTNVEHHLDTTLGELIAAVSDAALEVCNDKDTAYLLASIALEDILASDVRRGAKAPSPVSREQLRKNVISLRPAGL